MDHIAVLIFKKLLKLKICCYFCHKHDYYHVIKHAAVPVHPLSR